MISAKLNLRENVELAPYTTLGIGGPARYFFEARTDDDVAEAISLARAEGIPLFILGGGSNLLVSDSGFDGLVLKICLRGVDVSKDTVTAAAGEDWDALVDRCVDAELAGLECMSGIPGLVGGTPVQNVGAYGQEVSQTITKVRAFDRSLNDIVELASAECGFSYRTSIFNSTDRDRFVILGVTYNLRLGGTPNVEYRELKQEFAGCTPSIRDVRETVIKIRKQKSMVIDPGDPNSRSAGSFFKNPVVSQAVFAKLAGEYPEVPSFAFGDDVKVPAAWLIEQAGFHKGFSLGTAGVSANHTLAIVNRGGAKAADILSLKGLIQERVADKFGITLVPEPVFIGFK